MTVSLTPTQTASSTPEPAPTVTLTQITVPNPRDSLVGAIRWDAWAGDLPAAADASIENRPGLVVERTLGPAHWHDRLPFYAIELNETEVQVRATTQAIMDQEIAYAADAGLDYWAFVYYAPGSGLDIARDLYLSSTHKSRIHFCLIFDSLSRLQDTLDHGLLAAYFAMPEYQTVLGDRPLLFLFNIMAISQADERAIWETVEAVRQQATEAGAGDPYIAYMGWYAETVRIATETFGLDAGSAYAEAGGGGGPFAKLARAAELRWDDYRRAGLKVIPWVTSGWDPRPRVEIPVPWVAYDPNSWAETATPEEIAAHLQNALQWNARYPDVAEANTILIYAWNEFDEGGRLCPTLKEGTARLDALRPLLREIQE